MSGGRKAGGRGGGDVLAYAGCHGDQSVRIGSLPSRRTPALPLLCPSPHRQPAFSTGTSGSPRIRRWTPGSTEPSPGASLSTSRGNRRCWSWRGRYARRFLFLSPLSLSHSLSLSACCVSWLSSSAPPPPHAHTHARMHSTAVSKLAGWHLQLSEGRRAASVAFPPVTSLNRCPVAVTDDPPPPTHPPTPPLPLSRGGEYLLQG